MAKEAFCTTGSNNIRLKVSHRAARIATLPNMSEPGVFYSKIPDRVIPNVSVYDFILKKVPQFGSRVAYVS